VQNVLRELEQKKPQLDELVHTAENLKADSNRQQLHGKGRLTCKLRCLELPLLLRFTLIFSQFIFHSTILEGD
jgi:hypothetical protein